MTVAGKFTKLTFPYYTHIDRRCQCQQLCSSRFQGNRDCDQ